MKKVRASVFMNGKNQAVRFPKSMEIHASKVIIQKMGNGYFIEPESDEPWDALKLVVEEARPDFPDREPVGEQERDLDW